MEPAALKPLLTALAMPPLSLLLMAILGVLLLPSRRRPAGIALMCVALALLWLLSCHGTAVWLARNALPQYAPASAALLKSTSAQAIVVLGGGIYPEAPEYGEAQPSPTTSARLRYGIWLSRQSGLPLAFTGGLGRAPSKAQTVSEAQVAARVALQDYGFTVRWLESESRDTAENAALLAPLLKRDGISRIALVTDASHMPRSVAAFVHAGMIVTPAPMAYPSAERSNLLEWLPSASGLLASQQVLRERLALAAGT